ncbi:MAG: DUF3047 domain-containing protein [Proteobacteria bacterium]|nr:DUF3047 domain-containing protein [Pseudomonadota bacterium]
MLRSIKPVGLWMCLFCMLIGHPVYSDTLFKLDFANAAGDAESWFEKLGWEFEKDMDDMNPRFENGAFVVEPDDDDLGVALIQFEKKTYLKGYKRIRIEWGVNQYPKGASWAGPKEKERNTREPISLMVFFGEDKFDSGSSFVPNLPYCITFFLGENEKPGQIYYGNYWQKASRYFCESCDGSTNKTLITEINLADRFQKLFGKPAPPITGLTIEVDVQDTEKVNSRHSKAFIKKIEVFDN